MTVLQALSAAGGLAEWADKDGIRIIRRSGGKEEIIPFDYDKVISGKKMEQNILLQPNDTIVVP
jgi:polysaccharide export outer membrane protein